jgi:molybdopterin-biosynthesis enzyme MoeA-like protein
MTAKSITPGFGLIIVGNEILDGRREDRHLAACRELLAQRSIALSYVLLMPDRSETLESQLRWAMGRREPFFCCGGIGATPDDRTRSCAATAAGVQLEPHAEGVAILKKRFGEKATPARLEMVRFPRGSTLVPNPINQVPGFHLGNGFFLPGFPEMARPMMAWVLDSFYEAGGTTTACSLFVHGCAEADLAEMMRDFVASNPSASFSSLPQMTKNGSVLELGLSGPRAAVETARRDLMARLDACRIRYSS